MIKIYKEGFEKRADFGGYNSGEHAVVGINILFNVPAFQMGCNISNGTNVTVTAKLANTIYAIPFVAPQRGGHIAQMVTNAQAASNSARMGIYENVRNKTDMYPGALMAETQEYVEVVSDNLQFIQFSPDPNKLYWAVYVTNGTNNIQSCQAQQCAHFLGMSESATTSMITGLTVGHTFGAFPATFPGGAAFRENATIPLIKLRWGS